MLIKEKIVNISFKNIIIKKFVNINKKML